MPSRADVEGLREAQATLAALAQADLEDLVFQIVAEEPPDRVRDILLQLVPQLVSEYGDAAASAAAEWFEQTYGLSATMADSIRAPYAESGVRYVSRHLWTPDGHGRGAAAAPELTSALSGKADRWIKQAARTTIRRSAADHGMGWARVPQGGGTCAFCLILASRGAVYESRRSALSKHDGDKYHGHCDCAAIAVRSSADYPAGFDPDALYAVYSKARKAAGSADIESIAASIREVAPDLVTDGHAHP